MTLRERLLGGAVAGLRPLLPVSALVSPRVARAAAERRGAVDRIARWARESDSGSRPRIWLHGASAGELTGAAPAISELRSRLRIHLLVTYFSPSAESVLERLDPDFAEVLPLDTSGETGRALEASRPDALVFAKLDVWPNLTRSAAARRIPIGLINGTVRPDSSRLRPPARFLLRPAHGRLDRAGAISEEDADRLVRLGVRPEAIRVTGDASFAWALDRIERARADPASPARELRDRAPEETPVLVAGSTWRADEELLLAAAAALAEAGRPLWLVLVPHEPDRKAVARIGRRCAELHGGPPAVWSEAGRGISRRASGHAPRPLLVDVTGILAGLYQAADIAYVGGGLGRSGLHSVVEPAAAGVPILFGPRHSRREARDLLAGGAAREVTGATAAGTLREILERPGERGRMGRAARSYVEEEAAAAGASADLILELLSSSRGG